MWWDHDFGWGGWLAMTLGMAAYWILIALIVVALIRSGHSVGSDSLDARKILEQRLARGEIDVEEYQQRLEALSARHP